MIFTSALPYVRKSDLAGETLGDALLLTMERHPVAVDELMSSLERWFAELTTRKIKRGLHTSVQGLERDIRAWVATWNQNPRPYVWVKTADQILASLSRYCARISDSAH